MTASPYPSAPSVTPSADARDASTPHHPFLMGQRVYLRGIEEADIDGPYFQWFNDAETSRFNGHATFPNTMLRMRERFEAAQRGGTIVVFAVIERTSGTHVGIVSLQDIDWIARSAEIAFLIGQEHGGKGYGRDAGQLVMRYAFERLNLHRVHCGTSSEHVAMQKLAERLGMVREGVRRQAMYKLGRHVDVVLYGILRHEWHG